MLYDKNKLIDFIYEDLGYGDITTEAVVSSDMNIEAYITSKSSGILAGVEESCFICEFFKITCEVIKKDGDHINIHDKILKISGNARKILLVERVILNLLMKMSGIATKVNYLVSLCHKVNSKVKIAATRKTTPGFRFFEKKAVFIGGGDPHRWRLDDMYLIKSTHIDIAGGVSEAIMRVKNKKIFSKIIDVEVRNIDEAIEAIKNGADIIMLDNFTPLQVKETIMHLESLNLRNKILIEVSGGITEENILEYAKTGVDIISLGSLTHSYSSLDFHIELKVLGGPEGI